jgi:hypothetical protein
MSVILIIGAALVLLYALYINRALPFPSSEYIKNFARAKGIPNRAKSVHFEKTSYEAVRRSCEMNAQCIGFSDRRYFTVAGDPLKRGTPIYMTGGEVGEYAYIKDLYPTIFL